MGTAPHSRTLTPLYIPVTPFCLTVFLITSNVGLHVPVLQGSGPVRGLDGVVCCHDVPACVQLKLSLGVWVCTRDMLSTLWWVRVATKGSVGVVWGQGWAQSILTKLSGN